MGLWQPFFSTLQNSIDWKFLSTGRQGRQPSGHDCPVSDFQGKNDRVNRLAMVCLLSLGVEARVYYTTHWTVTVLEWSGRNEEMP